MNKELLEKIKKNPNKIDWVSVSYNCQLTNGDELHGLYLTTNL